MFVHTVITGESKFGVDNCWRYVLTLWSQTNNQKWSDIRSCIFLEDFTHGDEQKRSFQYGNLPCHIIRKVTPFSERDEANVIKYPPQSLDMKLIEHFWKVIFSKVHTSKPIS